MKTIFLASGLVLALALPLAPATPLGATTHVVTSDKPGGFDYVVTEVVVDVDGLLVLTNVDLRAHDVVAVADGPEGKAWCAWHPTRACPLFSSDLIGLAEQAVVLGTEDLTPLTSYPFYCSVHPWMVGTLTAI